MRSFKKLSDKSSILRGSRTPEKLKTNFDFSKDKEDKDLRKSCRNIEKSEKSL
jgi:hypothetical protein